MKGIELKTFLTQRGISGQELATRMNTTRQNISYMLNFQGDLKMSRLQDVAKALGIAVTEVLSADPNLKEMGRVAELQEKNKELLAEISELKAEIKQLRDWVDKLLAQKK